MSVKINDQIYCIRSDKDYGVKNHGIYNVVDIDSDYVYIMNSLGWKVGFKSTTAYFLDMTSGENLRRIRKEKLKRVFNIEEGKDNYV
jgi:hypothetical protein